MFPEVRQMTVSTGQFIGQNASCLEATDPGRARETRISWERPYKCTHCGNAFSQNGTLKRHLQTCKAVSRRDRIRGCTRNTGSGDSATTGPKTDSLDEAGIDTNGRSELDMMKLDEIDGRQATPEQSLGSIINGGRLYYFNP
ncbi:unnamed protein product [Echinostoma caproni]|uniref:C2H2-type domain-containing protein n=1 Tax=Echinostoma caproni TaxID=27848 RepID=A0A183AGU1_9TREM|nr:unnamed protein product [Echinostoma caproni]